MDVSRPGLARNRRRHHVSELPRVRDPGRLPRLPDGARDPPREALFAEGVEDARQRLLVPLVEAFPQRPAPGRVHAHVERPAGAKRESAAGIVELRRGNPEIHQRAVDLGEAELIEHGARVAEIPVGDDDVAAGQPGPRRRQRSRVLVDGHHPRPGVQQRLRMSSSAQGPVEDDATGPGGEQRGHLALEHGLVDETDHLRIALTRATGAATAEVASSTLRKSASSAPPAALRMLQT